MSAASEDRELHKVLVDAAQLRERYRAVSRDEPPDVLDALIRAAARDHTTPHAGSRLPPSWRVPLSIAAVVVVSATVSVLVAERYGQLRPDADHSVSLPAAASKDEKRAEAAAAQRQVPSAPPDKSEGKGRWRMAESPRQATPKQLGGAPQAASEAFSAPPESKPSEQPFKTQEAATQAPSQNVLSSAATQQAAPPPAASPRAEPERPEALRDQAPRQESTQEGRDRGAPERPADLLPRDRAAQTLAPGAGKLERDSTVAARKSATGPAWESDPEAWLKHIDELRLAGQRADAEASFRAFRDRYPAYRLPAGFVVPER